MRREGGGWRATLAGSEARFTAAGDSVRFGFPGNRGGFVDEVVQGKERYAQLFDPSAEYWKGRASHERLAISTLTVRLRREAAFDERRPPVEPSV